MFRIVPYSPFYQDGLSRCYCRVYGEEAVYSEHWHDSQVPKQISKWTDCFIALNTGTEAVVGFVSGQPFGHELKLRENEPDTRWITETRVTLGRLASSAYYIAELGVLKEFQHYGLGGLLLQHLITHVSTRNYECFVLRTSSYPKNPALGLYRRNDFHLLTKRTGRKDIPIASTVDFPRVRSHNEQTPPAATRRGPSRKCRIDKCSQVVQNRSDERYVYVKVARRSAVSRYSENDRIAQFVESDWWDVVAKWPGVPKTTSTDLFGSAHSLYASQVASAVVKAARKIGVSIRDVADIGSGAGRFVRELRTLSRTVRSVAVVDPNPDLLAVNALFNAGPGAFKAEPFKDQRISMPQELPLVAQSGEVVWVRTGRIPRTDNSGLKFYLGSTEALGKDGNFDVVSCLNVLDRHDKPRSLIGELIGLVRRNGLLIISSPLDWQPQLTPHADRCDTLRDLFEADGDTLTFSVRHKSYTLEVVHEDDVAYAFRSHPRLQTIFKSQLLVMRVL